MAAEAGIAYASVAMVTDYDCWKENEESVDVAKVLQVLKLNIDNVKRLFLKAIKDMENNWSSEIVATMAQKNQVKCDIKVNLLNFF